MEFDSTFWVAISFVIFFGVLIYFKIPRKINEALDTKISEIKNELDESEKLRIETKKLLEDSQSKLSSAMKESKKIIDQAKLTVSRVGGIYVSKKHCNYFINDGTGTCKNLEDLIMAIKKDILKQYNIKIEKEVCIY